MSDELTIDLRLLLPDVEDSSDTRAIRLCEFLTAQDGISIARLDPPRDGTHGLVRIDFEASGITRDDVVRIAADAGARITDRYGRITLRLAPFTNHRRASAASERLGSEPGVTDAKVTVDGTVAIEFDRTKISEHYVRSLLAHLNLRSTRFSGG